MSAIEAFDGPDRRQWPAHAVLILACGLIALPLVWMLTTAMKEQQDIFNKPFWWIPSEPRLTENVARVFSSAPFATYFGNSLVVCAIVAASDLFFSTLAGFSLAKYRFPGRRLFFALVLATMMIPYIVILIPQYIIVRNLGWLDTYAGLIIPFAVSGFGIFLMRQAFLDLPDELIEAARLDGAGEWRILFRIAVPLTRAPLISLAILRFLSEWDSLLWPLVATTSERMRTLSLGLALMQDDRYGTDFPMLMAAAAMAIAPVIAVYAFLQRYFIKSVAGSALNA